MRTQSTPETPTNPARFRPHDARPAEETRRLDQLSADLDTLARWIDPDAADWIASNSRVIQVRSLRP